MRLSHGIHLAYCTNIHRGETWGETFDSLKSHTLAVRKRVSPQKPYAIGLRLGFRAANELNSPAVLLEFKRWLDANNCYVFTINGFPYGQFHGTRVKESVYRPDWTTPERLEYTKLLFDILADILPAGIEGSVSTLPGSFKEFIATESQEQAIRDNFWKCVEHIAALEERTGKILHLGLEPEPLGYFETTDETIRFFDQMRSGHAGDARLSKHLGVNYDTCHLAVEFEKPHHALGKLTGHGIKISKLHLSSALRVKPTSEHLHALAAFTEDTYLHQVVVGNCSSGRRAIFKDLPDALAAANAGKKNLLTSSHDDEWRIHFHVPLHAPAGQWFETTADHVTGTLDELQKNPALCSHLEMETYTWEVLPPEMRARNVVDQLVAEYEWTLANLAQRGFRQE